MNIQAAEKALLQLAGRLDQPYQQHGEPDAVAMVLGHRARALYRGYIECANAGSHNAGRALLRPMVETNILLRFIRAKPFTRSQLWMAESRRI